MTQQDIEVAERLQAKARKGDGMSREGEEEFSKKYNAPRRSVFRKAGHAVLAVTSANPSNDLETARSTFERFDADGNGSLDKNELGFVLNAIGVKPTSIDKIFQSMDSDGSGDVDIDEFMLWMNGSASNKVMASDALGKMDTMPTSPFMIADNAYEIPSEQKDQKPVDLLDTLTSPVKTAPEPFDSLDALSPVKTAPKSLDSLDMLMSSEKTAPKPSDALEEKKEVSKVTVKVRKSVKVNPVSVKVKTQVDAGPPSQTAASDATGRAAIEQLFRKWDADGSGQLDREEFHGALGAMGMKPSHIDVMFDLADVDKSDSINVNEFIDWAFKEGIPGG